MSSKNFEITVPAGEYYLGDPCYAVRDPDWMPLLESCDYFDEPIGTVGKFHVYASGTAYGDGCYEDNNGNRYGVDAGLIGLVPVEYVEQTPADDRSLDQMTRIKLEKPTRFGYKDGTIYVGNQYRIETADEFSSDEEDDY